MHYYLNTLAIVSGVLTPTLVLWVLRAFREYAIAKRREAEVKILLIKARPNLNSKIEFFKVPNPNMIGVKLLKDGKNIWQGAVDKQKYHDTC